MDRRVTPPKRVTSPTWGPPPPRKQALRFEQGCKTQKLVFFADVKLYFSRSANWTYMQLFNLNHAGLPNHTCKGKCPTHRSNSQKSAFLATRMTIQNMLGNKIFTVFFNSYSNSACWI